MNSEENAAEYRRVSDCNGSAEDHEDVGVKEEIHKEEDSGVLESVKTDGGTGGVWKMGDDDMCVLCYERIPDAVVMPCGHGGFCADCLSRLAKRRCPTCRGRCRKVVVNGKEMTVKGLAAERHVRELRDLEETLQVVFVGGRTARVRRIAEKVCGGRGKIDWSAGGVYGKNGMIGDVAVKVGIVGRERGARRMMIDDVKCRRPDVLIVCWETGKDGAFAEMLEWDKLLRMDSGIPRIWMMITKGEKLVAGVGDEAAPGAHIRDDVVALAKLNIQADISSMRPPNVRPRAHYVVGTDNEFSIGLRSLMKDIVYYGRRSRTEALEAAIADAKELSLREARERGDNEQSGGGASGGGASEAELVEAGRMRMARMRQRDPVSSIGGFIGWLGE